MAPVKYLVPVGVLALAAVTGWALYLLDIGSDDAGGRVATVETAESRITAKSSLAGEEYESLVVENRALAQLNEDLKRRLAERDGAVQGDAKASLSEEYESLVVENRALAQLNEGLKRQLAERDGAGQEVAESSLGEERESLVVEGGALAQPGEERRRRLAEQDGAGQEDAEISLDEERQYLVSHNQALALLNEKLKRQLIKLGVEDFEDASSFSGDSAENAVARAAESAAANENLTERTAETGADAKEDVAASLIEIEDNIESLVAANQEFVEQNEQLISQLAEAGDDVKESGELVSSLQTHVSNLENRLDRQNVELASVVQEKDSVLQEKIRLDFAIRELEENYADEIERFKIQIEELENGLKLVTLANDVLFETGSRHLTADGRGVLNLIANSLLRGTDQSVRLEGHTDSVPIAHWASEVYPSNWELSAARAITAAQYLFSKDIPSDRVEIVVLGASRPIASNDTKEGRAQNRRLEIYLLPTIRYESAEGSS